VTAYTALMHCHRPLRFIDISVSPTDNACAACIVVPDSAVHRGQSMSNRAKAAFKFAREQLSQLGTLLGFRNVQELHLVAAPAMLALSQSATAAQRMHGMHASGAHVESEVRAMTSHLATVRRAAPSLRLARHMILYATRRVLTHPHVATAKRGRAPTSPTVWFALERHSVAVDATQ
jgi:hypothetical protein